MLVTFRVALHYVCPDNYHVFRSCDVVVELRLLDGTWLETCRDFYARFVEIVLFLFVKSLQSWNRNNRGHFADSVWFKPPWGSMHCGTSSNCFYRLSHHSSLWFTIRSSDTTIIKNVAHFRELTIYSCRNETSLEYNCKWRITVY